MQRLSYPSEQHYPLQKPVHTCCLLSNHGSARTSRIITTARSAGQFRTPVRARYSDDIYSSEANRPAPGALPNSEPQESQEAKRRDDGPLARLAVQMLSQFIANHLNRPKAEEVHLGYEGLVLLTKEVRTGRSADQQRRFIKELLDKIMPEFVAASFRFVFPCSQWAAEANAFITAKCFGWLVGDMELRNLEVCTVPDKSLQGSQLSETSQSWNSVVHIKKCKYLEATGCKAMCVNICKRPTQDFFANKLGFPVTMNPNFDDLSCEMRFGEEAPDILQDPVYSSLCLHAKGLQDSKECATGLDTR